MSCTTPTGNTGFKCAPDLGYPVAIAIVAADPAKTKVEISQVATWETLLKQTDYRVQLLPADLFENTPDEKVTETLSGGRDVNRFDSAGEMMLRVDKMPPTVVRTMAQQYDGNQIYYCVLYNKNYVLGRTDAATEMNFVWRKGTLSFTDEMSTETAATKGVCKFVSNDAEGDKQNKSVVKLDFNPVFDISALVDGKFTTVAGSTTSILKVKLSDKAIWDISPADAAIIINSADYTTALKDDLIVTNVAGVAQTITSVSAGTNTGEIDINFGTPLAADTYTVTMDSPANITNVSTVDYDFSNTSVDIAVS